MEIPKLLLIHHALLCEYTLACPGRDIDAPKWGGDEVPFFC